MEETVTYIIQLFNTENLAWENCGTYDTLDEATSHVTLYKSRKYWAICNQIRIVRRIIRDKVMLTCKLPHSSVVMSGSNVEYIIQQRVQDYWIDCKFDYPFVHVYEAGGFLDTLKQKNPDQDYQIVKRTRVFRDDKVSTPVSCRSTLSTL